jgi:histone acetyltransferase (RNA polymerase elongator complex component)
MVASVHLATAKKMAVISGIGVREYYKKQKYSLSGAYMIKDIEKYD